MEITSTDISFLAGVWQVTITLRNNGWSQQLWFTQDREDWVQVGGDTDILTARQLRKFMQLATLVKQHMHDVSSTT